VTVKGTAIKKESCSTLMNKHGLIVTEQEVPFYQRRKVRCTLLEPDRDNERYLFVTVNVNVNVNVSRWYRFSELVSPLPLEEPAKFV
jgi:hypothetical protein